MFAMFATMFANGKHIDYGLTTPIVKNVCQKVDSPAVGTQKCLPRLPLCIVASILANIIY